MAQKGKGVTI
ncbi:Protein of unknown function [Bacillus thuringiensis]|uniref:Uncharacterized protein n=1 Tax=Bacillus thuringiensis TaxID=1428 RepID=A0A1C4E455_BACTU|nr:Protein of unknown function [Bacillus thuringiensis]